MKLLRVTILLIISFYTFSFIAYSEKVSDSDTDFYENKSPEYSYGLPAEQETGIGVLLRTNNVTCTALGSASIDILSSCTGAPTITWSHNNHQGSNILNLPTGLYSVTVSDGGDCRDTVINFSIGFTTDYSLSIIPNGNICVGPVTLTAAPTGADISQVSFFWDPPLSQTTQNVIVNQDNVQYKVTATYGTCTLSDSITLSSSDFFDIQYTEFICSGMEGTATVNFLSGENPAYYSFQWSPNVSGSLIAQSVNLPVAGDYSVTVTHIQSGCSATKTIATHNAPSINLRIDHQDISCYGMTDGSATAVASGGMGAFSYAWSLPNSTTNRIENLLSGNYYVTVTDGNGCTATESVFITEPEQFFYMISGNQGICRGESVIISLNVVGGVTPYSYQWEGGNDPLPGHSSITVTPPVTTIYSVTATDANGCTAAPQSTRITVSQPITIEPRTTNLNCHGDCIGKAILNVTGGIPPFVYSWDSNTDSIGGLCAGSYSVTITDLYSCSAQTSFTISEPTPLVVSATSGPASCYGYEDGFIQVFASGGVPFEDNEYIYRWNSGHQVDSTATGAGFYTVTVTDANNCTNTASVRVNQPEEVYISPITSSARICIGQSFSVTAEATGGFGDYDFVWHGSDNSLWYGENLNTHPITTTTYTLSVTDQNGCTAQPRNVTIIVFPEITIRNITADINEVCYGENVSVRLEIEGGNGGPYNIFFQNNELVNSPHYFAPENSGYYWFRVTDDCTTPAKKDSVFVNVLPLPNVNFQSDIIASCPPGNIKFTEITEDTGQTYEWSFGDGGISVRKNPTHVYKESGFYTVAVTSTSLNGCKNTKKIDDYIEIYENPTAEFIASPSLISILNPTVKFTNYSSGAEIYFWDFGDGAQTLWTTDQTFMHTYSEIEDYEIMLIAKSDKGCVDTVKKSVKVHDEFSFYAPTAFTPNNDGINDYFYVTGHGIDKNSFKLIIQDRYGNVIFEVDRFDAENPINMSWDGTTMGKSKKVETGLYIWKCNFTDFTGKPYEKSGTVTLLR